MAKKYMFASMIIFLVLAAQVYGEEANVGIAPEESFFTSERAATGSSLAGKPAALEAAELFTQATKIAADTPKEAIQLYQSGLLLQPDAWKERFNLAVLRESTGNIIASLPEYEQAQTHLKTVETFAAYSHALAKAGYMSEATQNSVNAAEIFPENPTILQLAGQQLTATGESLKAIPLIEKASRLSPDSPDILTSLADAYVKTGRTVQAYLTFQKVLSLKPGHEQAASGLKGLQDTAAMGQGFIVFPPKGWVARQMTLENTMGAGTLEIVSGAGGNAEALATALAAAEMPEELRNAPTGIDNEEVARLQEHLKQGHNEEASVTEIVKRLQPPGAIVVTSGGESLSPMPKEMSAALAWFEMVNTVGKETQTTSVCVFSISSSSTSVSVIARGDEPVTRMKPLLVGMTEQILFTNMITGGVRQ